MARVDREERQEKGEKRSSEEGPYFYGRGPSSSGIGRLLDGLLRALRGSTGIGFDLLQRALIEVEIASLRLRLRTLYGRLGEMVFRMRVAEERGDVLENEEVLSLFERIRSTHSRIAAVRHRREELSALRHEDDFAGA